MRAYRIAGQAFFIDTIHNFTYDYCRDYEIPAEEAGPDAFVIRTTQTDIDFERRKSEQEDLAEGHPVMNYDDPYLESLSVYRKLADRLAREYDTILFHGSALAFDGDAYLFTGKSGTGKSTHTRLWRKVYKTHIAMINDDKPFVRISDNEARIYGTPYDGKHRISSNISAPLKGIILLEQAKENRIETIQPYQELGRLMQQIYRSSDSETVLNTTLLAGKLFKTVPVYKMYCNMEDEAARVAHDYLRGMKNET